MNKLFVVLASVCLLLISSSCLPWMRHEYETITYYKVYRVDSLKLWKGRIYPYCTYDDAIDSESREFYESIGTSLTFRRLKPNLRTHMEHRRVAAIDWRIKSIEVTTMFDFDSLHPAGSSLNDLLYIVFKYKDNRTELPLAEVGPGSLMLMDHYPYDIDWTCPRLDPINDPHYAVELDSVMVRIEDDFGRTFELVPEKGAFKCPKPADGWE